MLTLNKNLQNLLGAAQKPVKTGIGLMSGTSLDGLDIALCEFTGNGLQTQFKLLNFITVPYAEGFKKEVRSVFARKEADLEKVCLLNAYIGNYHGELVLSALETWGVGAGTVDFIASHGQTIYHAPKRLHGNPLYPNATLQIGDGDHIAVKTGILTISDFRQKHIAAGGEGAPLALYGDVLLGSQPGENRILLNIGGIANLTYLPADGDHKKVLCTDVGPGNTLIDAAMQKYFNLPYDEGSQVGLSGTVNDELLTALLAHPFFKDEGPKTTGPELFNLAWVGQSQRLSGTTGIAPNDLIATLVELSAQTIADFINGTFSADNIKTFVSGGGLKNQMLIKSISQYLMEPLGPTSAIGISPDAKEAILFALLGNEALCGEPIAIGSNPAVLMGKFSFPG